MVWEKICINHILHKRLDMEHIKHSQNNNKKENSPIFFIEKRIEQMLSLGKRIVAVST